MKSLSFGFTILAIEVFLFSTFLFSREFAFYLGLEQEILDQKSYNVDGDLV